MSTLVYALALFGCSDDASLCERLSDKAKEFHSVAQCEMAIEPTFDSDLVLRTDYPTIVAQCMPKSEWTRIGNRPVDLSSRVIRLASRD